VSHGDCVLAEAYNAISQCGLGDLL
jgi:hypothetical protein